MFYSELTPYPTPSGHMTQAWSIRDVLWLFSGTCQEWLVLSSGVAKPVTTAGSHTSPTEKSLNKQKQAGSRTRDTALKTLCESLEPAVLNYMIQYITFLVCFGVAEASQLSLNWISGILCGNFPNTKTVRNTTLLALKMEEMVHKLRMQVAPRSWQQQGNVRSPRGSGKKLSPVDAFILAW